MDDADVPEPFSPRARSSSLLHAAELPEPEHAFPSPSASTAVASPTFSPTGPGRTVTKKGREHKRPPSSRRIPIFSSLGRRSSSEAVETTERRTGWGLSGGSKTAPNSRTQSRTSLNNVLTNSMASTSHASVHQIPRIPPPRPPRPPKAPTRPSTAPSPTSDSTALDPDADYSPPPPTLPVLQTTMVTENGEFFLLLGHLEDGDYELKLEVKKPVHVSAKDTIRTRRSFFAGSPVSEKRSKRGDIESVKLVAQVSTKKLTSVFGVMKEWEEEDIMPNADLTFSVEPYDFPLRYIIEGQLRSPSMEVTWTLSRQDPFSFAFDLPSPSIPSPHSGPYSRRRKLSRIMHGSISKVSNVFHRRTLSHDPS
ncbi:hypothetical protein BT69DRAFT_1276547 [Atractiella rhizophila]|nr:hypothetical protein BT69DRAFT_1276547 [Atractiella rhizophila]